MSSQSRGDIIERIKTSKCFTVDDIDVITETALRVGNAPGSEWDDFRNSYLALPGWFDFGLDPIGDAYKNQQRRLWRELAGRDSEYDPHRDEGFRPPPHEIDPLRFPGGFIRRDENAVAEMADHVIANGMILKHSGLKPGAWALEYGAGFGQTALTLARLGVNVDTVDICPLCCGYVKMQADFFGVNMHPFEGVFGMNPRGNRKYDLIYFYESFHHCIEFNDLIKKIRNFLTPNGKVLLAGEPIKGPDNLYPPYLPYPWGLRLEAFTIVAIRDKGWLELGFRENFITNLFTNHGFTAEKHRCDVSTFGTTLLFSLRKNIIEMGAHWMPGLDAETWHAPEPGGRWTTGHSTMALDRTDSFSELIIHAVNHHNVEQRILIEYGGREHVASIEAGEQSSIRIRADSKSVGISFRCETRVPANDDPASKDKRALGVFVQKIEYA